MMTVDVIIPTCRPDKKFEYLMERLQKQEYPIHKIMILNTMTEVKLPEIQRMPYPVEIMEIRPEEFDHGATRNLGARASEADILIYLTQDAVPADKRLITEFVNIFEKYRDINLAYGRQMPNKDCSIIEKYTRSFNYLIRFRIIGDRAARTPAYPPAQYGIKVSGTVNQFRMIHLDHLAADRENLW